MNFHQNIGMPCLRFTGPRRKAIVDFEATSIGFEDNGVYKE